jgi:hypothetical protein
MKNKIAAITIGLTLLLTANKSMAGSITLYDGNSGVTPDQYNSPSPWLTFATTNLLLPTVLGTQTVNSSNNSTTLNSNSANINTIYAGYSNYNSPTTIGNSSFPTLDRNAGYQLTFTVKINSQSNSSSTRAGFSVIALSSDKQGIEIGFRNSDIFSQADSSFNTIGEQVNNTKVPNIATLLGSLTTYNLAISGNNYTLTSGTTNLLSGAIRDYTTATNFGTDVYRTPNFIFLGDNTTSARASIDLANVSLTTNSAPVPFELSETVSICVLGAYGGLNYWLRKQKSKQLNINK